MAAQYSPNKDKLRRADKDWEQNVVSGLDSSLNAWVDTIPEHLRWDPHRESEIFFNQSVVLYTDYYNIQILIHKPYIPSPRNTPHLKFPSLAICTNAARSSSHIVDTQRQRGFSWGRPFTLVRWKTTLCFLLSTMFSSSMLSPPPLFCC